ncbi:hypothetical protein SAMN04487825_101224 [Prevotella sp. kh1p2]|nr:hypothetical protein SAMN04487825_101224 [Prevotella sp. kh1p2]SNU10030.1 hypothetical protein SAMN06298210_10161 [Prevotellaceae bacterium KH2P17]
MSLVGNPGILKAKHHAGVSSHLRKRFSSFQNPRAPFAVQVRPPLGGNGGGMLRYLTTNFLPFLMTTPL